MFVIHIENNLEEREVKVTNTIQLHIPHHTHWFDILNIFCSHHLQNVFQCHICGVEYHFHCFMIIENLLNCLEIMIT